MSEVIVGWMREDGTITYDRKEITGHFRKVVSQFKNSDGFIKRMDAQFEKQFPLVKK